MAGEINYYEVFGVTKGEASPAESASGSAPEHGEEGVLREKSAAHTKEKDAAATDVAEAGAGQRSGGRLQPAEKNARFAAGQRERERRDAVRVPAVPEDTGTADEQGELQEKPVKASPALIPEDEPVSFEGQTAPAQAMPENGAAAFETQLLQLRRAEAAARAERDYAVDRSIRQRIESEVTEIGRLDPAVRSWEDIRNTPGYERLGELVRGGVSLVDAYKLVHFDRLTGNAAAGARQAALNARNGKAHLQSLSGTGGETLPAVPGEVLRAYRAIMPELSVREIEQHYNQYLKG